MKYLFLALAFLISIDGFADESIEKGDFRLVCANSSSKLNGKLSLRSTTIDQKQGTAIYGITLEKPYKVISIAMRTKESPNNYNFDEVEYCALIEKL